MYIKHFRNYIIVGISICSISLTACIGSGNDSRAERQAKRRAEQQAELAEVNASHPGRLLMTNNDCKTCHMKTRKHLGPALIEIAEKYDSTKQNITLLTGKVKKGGTGVWGTQIMNAHPDVSDQDIAEMVSYIVSLDGK